MKTELIITTYNSVRALELCLVSVARQSLLPDTICIADDGSGPETKEFIDGLGATYPNLTFRHVWHEDQGFEKCRILNKAIESSEAEFLFFLDGDVMIHPNFLKRHFDLAQRGRFSTGSLIRLDETATEAMTSEIVTSGDAFDRSWLRENRAIDRLGTWLKTMPFPFAIQNLLDVTTPVQKALCGANWSAFREDILKVNGFDETLKYGGLDKEFGIRLINAGVKGRHLRYTAPLVHLDHPRGYRDPEKVKRHKAMIKEVRTSGRSWTEDGIIKGPKPV
ncbi:Glycosyltransferase, GT2 family [Cognatiyoonia sediminum]|uniref:Glycosyltransferase, GT2 family n=1 Tax=Cognatiyoonia sediminum TaxID=1508389 RepID=A0A1M5RCE4_9RHOB|nr:glycosyltransferase [Cognatiyoonia sediminum]SHH23848.1 Glycosyltransferase, GT2 family [Cognatiyoonia sediminum]